MDNQGWIKLYRKILDNEELFGKTYDFALFAYFILKADRTTGIARCGRQDLAKRFRADESTIYKAMKRIEKGGLINIKSNNQFSDVYICKYQEYQAQSNNESNNKVTTKEQQSNTIQEVRSKKNIYYQQADSKNSLAKGEPMAQPSKSQFAGNLFGTEIKKPVSTTRWQQMALDYSKKFGFEPSASWFKFFKNGNEAKLQDTYAKMFGLSPSDPEKYFYKLYGGNYAPDTTK